MRVPLDAHQTVTLTHIVRKGTASESYTVVLSGVSCHETNGVLADGSGFSHSDNSTSFCIFPLYTTAALSDAPEQASAAGDTYPILHRQRSRPQTPRSGAAGGRWLRRTKFSCPVAAPAPWPACRTTGPGAARTGMWR